MIREVNAIKPKPGTSRVAILDRILLTLWWTPSFVLPTNLSPRFAWRARHRYPKLWDCCGWTLEARLAPPRNQCHWPSLLVERFISVIDLENALTTSFERCRCQRGDCEHRGEHTTQRLKRLLFRQPATLLQLLPMKNEAPAPLSGERTSAPCYYPATPFS